MTRKEELAQMVNGRAEASLVTGKSGYGKTFFCTQLINEKILTAKVSEKNQV